MRIDPHVHFRDAEESYKETITHGLSLARDQGVDIVCDMPNTKQPLLIYEDVERRLKLVPKRSAGRYSLYVGVTTDNNQLAEAVDMTKVLPEVVALKMFAGKSIGNLVIIEEEEQLGVY